MSFQEFEDRLKTLWLKDLNKVVIGTFNKDGNFYYNDEGKQDQGFPYNVSNNVVFVGLDNKTIIQLN